LPGTTRTKLSSNILEELMYIMFELGQSNFGDLGAHIHIHSMHAKARIWLGHEI
jgi:hypothetical protein